MGRQGIKLDKAHAFSSRFLQLCAQEEKALSQWGAIFHTTRQTISNWQTGESVPDIIKLADIAQYFGVSTDYLLGLSDTKSPDAGAKAAVEYTGLSEEAVERLHSGLKDYELEEIQLSKDIIMCNQRITFALDECRRDVQPAHHVCTHRVQRISGNHRSAGSRREQLTARANAPYSM